MQTPDYRIDPAALLDPEDSGELAAWYASPLPWQVAEQLLLDARRCEQRMLAAGEDLFAARLAALIAGYWLGRPVALEYGSLLASVALRQRALLELVYGQLLISRKRAGASDHLRRGFLAAAQLLAPKDYFAVLKRHDLLCHLCLTEAGSAPMDLPQLLNEAKVISRLESATSSRSRPPHNKDDTLG